MTKVRKIFMWLYMLNKRLYRRPSFLVMLSVIVAITAILTGYAKEDSNVLRIALYARHDNTREFLEEYAQKESIIGYTFFGSEKDAVYAVTNKGLDAAWIFDEDINESADKFIGDGKEIVKVIQREDSVFLKLSREKLFALVYPLVSKSLYNNYMNNKYNENDLSLLDGFYEKALTPDEIVDVRLNDSSFKIDDLNYITGPIRGLLSIAMFLCAYAALINSKKDKISGLYSRLSAKSHIYVELASVFVATINAALVTLISLKLTGVFVGWYEEICYILQYAVLCVMFCVVLGALTENINYMSALMPVIVMFMIALCPIFINSKVLKPVKMLLPPYYYLSILRNGKFYIYGYVYIIASGILVVIIKHLKDLKYKMA